MKLYHFAENYISAILVLNLKSKDKESENYFIRNLLKRQNKLGSRRSRDWLIPIIQIQLNFLKKVGFKLNDRKEAVLELSKED